jgi:hypothetical protein
MRGPRLRVAGASLVRTATARCLGGGEAAGPVQRRPRGVGGGVRRHGCRRDLGMDAAAARRSPPLWACCPAALGAGKCRNRRGGGGPGGRATGARQPTDSDPLPVADAPGSPPPVGSTNGSGFPAPRAAGQHAHNGGLETGRWTGGGLAVRESGVGRIDVRPSRRRSLGVETEARPESRTRSHAARSGGPIGVIGRIHGDGDAPQSSICLTREEEPAACVDRG